MIKKLLPVLCLLLVSASLACASPRIMARHLKEAGGIDITVPVLPDGPHAEKLNALLGKPVWDQLAAYREMLLDSREYVNEHFTCFADYKIKYDKNGLLSVVLYGYQYTGGAHGASWQTSVTFREEDGRLFTLDSLFKTGGDYQKILNEHITAKISRRPGWPEATYFEGITPDTLFYLTEEALVIYYQPYEIAPYVFGLPTFVLDLYDLDGLFAEEIRF